MIYGYCRVSTSTQAEKGFGLDNQENEIKKYAAENGLTIEKIFTDAGVSGTMESRPALDEMLAGLAEGDEVLVLCTSRLWRDLFTQAVVLKAFQRAKAEIISLQEPEFSAAGFLQDPNQYMILSIMMALDSWERLTINRKLAQGRATKARRGDKPSGTCPLGYQFSADKKSIVVVESEAAIVKRIFSLAQTGTSIPKIAAALNADGITTRRGGAWATSSINAILHNEFYSGTLEHAGEKIKGNHEALISKVQFGKVQNQLAQRNKHV